jgi:hypothetical protein
MNTLKWFLALVVVAALVSAGCGKSSTAPQTAEVNGVSLDLPKLNEAFANATPEQKSTATQVTIGVRYMKYEDALMALDKLANDPSVTEAQKKVVNTVIEQVKKLANAAPAAAPAQ